MKVSGLTGRVSVINLYIAPLIRLRSSVIAGVINLQYLIARPTKNGGVAAGSLVKGKNLTVRDRTAEKIG
jgi:hypothetical protein